MNRDDLIALFLARNGFPPTTWNRWRRMPVFGVTCGFEATVLPC